MSVILISVVDSVTKDVEAMSINDELKCKDLISIFIEKNKSTYTARGVDLSLCRLVNQVSGQVLPDDKTLSEVGVKQGDVVVMQFGGNVTKRCERCGTENISGAEFCIKCGNRMSNNQMVVTGNTGYVSAPSVTEFLNYKKIGSSIIGVILSICGMISGVVSFILGLEMFDRPIGLIEFDESYGGDAYTGIQNATASAVNNLYRINETLKYGIGYLLIAIGLISIFVFALRLFKIKTKR